MSLIRSVILLSALLFLSISPVQAQEIASTTLLASATADTMFDMMEKRTEKINSIRVEVLLKNNLHSKNCKLLIMNPNKFAIEFDDASIQTFFDGSKLWLKIAELKEVFYHFSDSNSSFLSYIPLFNPTKIFTNLTRKSLFSLFNVTLTDQQKSSNNNFNFYTLKFVPKMKSVFKEVFSIGHYLMIFSDENYLPVEVIEFDPDGNERGRLIVKQYFINESIPASSFEFTPPPDYTLVPLSVVFAQKLEECGNYILNRIGEAASSMKNTILDWGF